MNTPKRLRDGLCVCAGVALALLVASPSLHAAPGDPYAVWVVGQGEKDGRAVTIRWRDASQQAGVKAAHRWCVEITWRFHRNADGKVPADESERALDFETGLEQAIKPPDLAIGVASITDDDKRVWIYYAADRDAFAAVLDGMKHDDPALPISYESRADGDWQAFQQVLGLVKE